MKLMGLVVITLFTTLALGEHAGVAIYATVGNAGCDSTPEEFRNAEHPYAKKPDGCSGIDSPKEVRDSWGPVKFKGACNGHDRCYYTEGSDWKNCNDEFRKDLEQACKNGLRIKVLGRRLPPEPTAFAACLTIAESYYLAVQGGVMFGVYKDAQDLQKRYNNWHRGCFGG